MAYASPIAPGTIVIDDTNFHEHVEAVVDGEPKLRGRVPRNWLRCPYGSRSFASAFPEEALIPENEYDDRIKEKEESHTTIMHVCDAAGLFVLDQDGTNYCWVNAPTDSVMVTNVVQGGPLVRLSPAAVGAPIKNYSNSGGWGGEALKYYVEHGGVPQEFWPPNAIKKQYDTAETRAMRDRWRVLEWWDLKPRNAQQMYSCILVNQSVDLGLNWWSHEVNGVGVVIVNGNPQTVLDTMLAEYGVHGNYRDLRGSAAFEFMEKQAELAAKYGTKIRNSWGEKWSDHGYGILTGSKQLPDDAVCPRVTVPA